MQEWIIQTMNQFGYIGIMLLIAIENVFPPIPSEVILTFGGFSTTYTDMQVWGVVIAATVGAVIGALCCTVSGDFSRRSGLKAGSMDVWARCCISNAKTWNARHIGLRKRGESPFSPAALSRSSAA